MKQDSPRWSLGRNWELTRGFPETKTAIAGWSVRIMGIFYPLDRMTKYTHAHNNKHTPFLTLPYGIFNGPLRFQPFIILNCLHKKIKIQQLILPHPFWSPPPPILDWKGCFLSINCHPNNPFIGRDAYLNSWKGWLLMSRGTYWFLTHVLFH